VEPAFSSPFDQLSTSETLLFECLSGSRSYGLHTNESDIDIRGIYLAAKTQFFNQTYPDQLQDDLNNHVYFEVGKFFRLLAKSNPTILEMLATGMSNISVSHPIISTMDHERLYSKQCRDSFGGFALSQIRKARSVRRLIKLRKGAEPQDLLDFCRVVFEDKMVELKMYLTLNKIDARSLGVEILDATQNLYLLGQHSRSEGLRLNESTGKLIPSEHLADERRVLLFDYKRYTEYRKESSGYWEWKQNQANPLSDDLSRAYDSKNMMHCFRLLQMGIDLAKTGVLVVERSDREFLLDIRNHNYEFDWLIRNAEEKIEEMDEAFDKSDLREAPDLDYLSERLLAVRSVHYG
jgi:uncharacterized protein